MKVIITLSCLVALAAAFPVYVDEIPSGEKRTDFMTSNAGAPVDNAHDSQTVNPRGPILLQDAYLIERLQVHNRERIPERNVHARGATAKGVFKVTHDVSNYTFAKLFSEVGKETPIAIRFSSVIHGKDSPEFLRDPRGFAIKFYTEEGNYDIVGLNFPVFFIRDGIRFPEMIRSLKPNPKSGVQEWWRIWDYFSHYPEATHMFSWLLDDVGVPRSYREMDGWGIHTFKWISPEGKETWVRYYYESKQGVHSLDDDEAAKQHFSFHTTDLYENIEKKNYPEWDVYVQLIDPETTDFDKLDFDVLDTTKEWPADVFPMQPLGTFVLNENVNSQFLENEMIAFSPSRLVPGIEPSDEKMLQTRMFAYPDTQRYRLGVNNQMLPINRPKCPFMDNHIDGAMNFMVDGRSADEVNYFPSVHDPLREAHPFHHETEVAHGTKIRQSIPKENFFSQAGKRYRSFDDDRKTRFVNRVASTMTGDRLGDEVKNKWLDNWAQADKDLAQRIERAIEIMTSGGEGRRLSSNESDSEYDELISFRAQFLRSSGSSL